MSISEADIRECIRLLDAVDPNPEPYIQVSEKFYKWLRKNAKRFSRRDKRRRHKRYTGWGFKK